MYVPLAKSKYAIPEYRYNVLHFKTDLIRTISYLFIYNNPVLELGQPACKKEMEQDIRKPELEMILSLRV